MGIEATVGVHHLFPLLPSAFLLSPKATCLSVNHKRGTLVPEALEHETQGMLLPPGAPTLGGGPPHPLTPRTHPRVPLLVG